MAVTVAATSAVSIFAPASAVATARLGGRRYRDRNHAGRNYCRHARQKQTSSKIGFFINAPSARDLP
jgi:hypothetical protein